jgi:hypothetical protein
VDVSAAVVVSAVEVSAVEIESEATVVSVGVVSVVPVIVSRSEEPRARAPALANPRTRRLTIPSMARPRFVLRVLRC